MDERVNIYVRPRRPRGARRSLGRRRPPRAARRCGSRTGVVKNLYVFPLLGREDRASRAAAPSRPTSSWTAARPVTEELIARHQAGHPRHPHLVHPHGRSADAAAHRPHPRRHVLRSRTARSRYPVKNFRFNECPVIMLNNLDALGKPVRFSDGGGPGGGALIPPMRIRDFTSRVFPTRCSKPPAPARSGAAAKHRTGGHRARPYAGATSREPQRVMHDFTFTRLRYDSGRLGRGRADAGQRARLAGEYTTLDVDPEERLVALRDAAVLEAPFTYLAGHRLVRVRPPTSAATSSATCATAASSSPTTATTTSTASSPGSSRRRWRRSSAPTALRKLPKAHALYRAFFHFDDGPPTTSLRAQRLGRRPGARLPQGDRDRRPRRRPLQQQGLRLRVGLRLAQQALAGRGQHQVRASTS